MKKIVTVLGARPQFIKAAMVSRELAGEESLQEIIIHTGQHFDTEMSEIFFREMDIPSPAYNLGVSGGTHGTMTGRMMMELEPILIKEKPGLLLLYGDTNSTLAGALVARKLNIPIAHVEAGLRNFDMRIPEDVNRILTDRVSALLFCPTNVAIENLKKEGFESFPCAIIKTGDLMFDAVVHYAQLLSSKQHTSQIKKPQKYILCTIHRALNTEPPGIFETFEALNSIAGSEKIIFPIHPRTKKALLQNHIELHPNIVSLPPQGYLDMVDLLKDCSSVITDSGGLQKEAYALKKKSLLLMSYTPWEELVENQFSVVTGIEKKAILKQWEELQTLMPDFNIQLYGTGNTGKCILKEIKSFLFSQ